MLNTVVINQKLEKTSEEIFRERRILYNLLSEILENDKSEFSILNKKDLLSTYKNLDHSKNVKKKFIEKIKSDFYSEENLVKIHEKLLLNNELLEVINKIAATDSALYKELVYSDYGCVFEGKVFEFSDIVLLDDRSFQKVLRTSSKETIAVAFIGECHSLKEKLYRNLSCRAISDIKKIMRKKIKSIKQNDILKKQGLILKAVHRLIKQGEICIVGELDYDY